VYVGRNSGAVMATVTSVTRWTTWFGTVPHFLYFKWLYYDRMPLWIWVNIVMPSVTMVVAVSGIVLGLVQLFPRRRKGEWRFSAYRGVSKWHHVAGVVFGVMVLSWMVSGLFQMIGVEATPGRGQVEAVQAGAMRWQAIKIGEAAAWDSLRARMPGTGLPRAVDLSQFDGRPGYEFILADGRTFWVDAASGITRGDLARSDLEMAARRVVASTAPITAVDRLTEYDTYYYARHGREEHLPVWRVRFGTEDGAAVYLHTVTGTPLGFVNTTVRRSRWLRDGLHSLDLPGLNNRRPLWDFMMLPLLFGGMLCALTGVWLLVRRVRRMAGAPPSRS
jgi:hypothetical protein